MGLREFLFSFGHVDQTQHDLIESMLEAVEYKVLLNGTFSKALKFYTDKACEKQRENCVKHVKNNANDYIVPESLLNATQPKLEELL